MGYRPPKFPLQAVLSLSVVDNKGRAQQRMMTLPLRHLGRQWIGARVVPRAGRNVHDPIDVDLIVLDDKLQPMRTGSIERQLLRRQQSVVWQNDGGAWQFVSGAGLMQPTGGSAGVSLALGENTPAKDADGCPTPTRISVTPGRAGSFVVRLSMPGATTELDIGNGWTSAPDGKIEPDSLVVRTDKETYQAGEPIVVSVETPHERGRVLGEVMIQGSVAATFESDVVDYRAKGEVRVGSGDTWPEGDAHIYVTSFQQAKKSGGVSDGPTVDTLQDGPARAVGGTRIRIGAGEGNATLQISSPPETYTHADLENGITVDVIADRFAPDAWVSLAAVDEGILALTDYKTPDPRAHYFGGRQLGFDVFDTYGRILYGKVGGGEGYVREVRGTSFTQSDLVAFQAPFVKVENGRARFVIPASAFPRGYMGKVRLMAWGWDAGQVASDEKAFIVRDPVAVHLATPSFIAPGDAAMLPLTVKNLDNRGVDRVAAEITADTPLRFDADLARAAGAEPCSDGAELETCVRFVIAAKLHGPESEVSVPLQVAGGAASEVTAGLTLSYDLLREQSGEVEAHEMLPLSVAIRPPYPEIAMLGGTTRLPPGQFIKLDAANARAAAHGLSSESPVRILTRISRHPLAPTSTDVGDAQVHRLAQLAEEAQFLISASSITATPLDQRSELIDRVNALVRQITSLQSSEGGFVSDHDHVGADAPADTSSADELGNTAFAVDLLQRARRAGASVDEETISSAVAWLLGEVLSRTEAAQGAFGNPPPCVRGDLYALIVLSRYSQINSATFGQVVDSCSSFFETDPSSRLLLVAAFSAFGLTEQAHAAMAGLQGTDILAQVESGEAGAVIQAAALTVEQGAGDTDPMNVLSEMGLSNSEMPMDLATESWRARFDAAVLAALQNKSPAPPFDSADLDCQPASAIASSFEDGVDLKPLIFDAATGAFRDENNNALSSATPVTCTNCGDKDLYVSLDVQGTPAKIKGPAEGGFAIDLRMPGSTEDEQGAIVVKQYQPLYFIFDVSPTTAHDSPERLAAVQLLPAGFEVVDRSYNKSWEDVLGSAAAADAMSRIDYVEVQPDRWVGMPAPPESANALANYRLAFSLRPTFVGTFTLPPLVVRDLNNPRRMSWTGERKIIVEPTK